MNDPGKDLIRKIGELSLQRDELLAALKLVCEKGMVAAPGPHFRWDDEYYEVFKHARAAIKSAEESQ